jgi:hypothetical protein
MTHPGLSTRRTPTSGATFINGQLVERPGENDQQEAA